MTLECTALSRWRAPQLLRVSKEMELLSDNRAYVIFSAGLTWSRPILENLAFFLQKPKNLKN